MATPNQLAHVIKQLQAARQEHVDAIARLDEVFGEHDITPAPRKRRRRRVVRPAGVSKKKAEKRAGKKRGAKKAAKKKTTKKGSRKRKKFKMSGEASVSAFVKSHNNCTTAQINAHWQHQGRGGTADNTLTQLVKDGKLKRQSIAGARGSTFIAA